ncbi:hypothetical protein [Nocardia paucivorans]|uniref:hypothetical protein n=1 Tax=Nocardia paucivorans TaxID=114259 RepID=UPI000308FAB4|nr:hypothetical protein [Nocardia paucivorans]
MLTDAEYDPTRQALTSELMRLTYDSDPYNTSDLWNPIRDAATPLINGHGVADDRNRALAAALATVARHVADTWPPRAPQSHLVEAARRIADIADELAR